MVKRIRDLKKFNRFAQPEPSQLAVIYCRYSPRRSEDSRTIEVQEDCCRAYIEKQNWKQHGETFADYGESGTKLTGRDELAEAIKACKSVGGALVVYSLTRLARNVKDALDIIDDLHAHGCNVVIIDFLIDSTTYMGRMLFTVVAALAELQARQGAETTSTAMRKYQKNGYSMGGKPPYGWKLGDRYEERMMPDGLIKRLRTLEIDEEEQRALDVIMECEARGWSPNKIAKHLDLLGFRTRGKKKKWSHKVVWGIILREKRCGNPARASANPDFVRKYVGMLAGDSVDAGQAVPAGVSPLHGGATA